MNAERFFRGLKYEIKLADLGKQVYTQTKLNNGFWKLRNSTYGTDGHRAEHLCLVTIFGLVALVGSTNSARLLLTIMYLAPGIWGLVRQINAISLLSVLWKTIMQGTSICQLPSLREIKRMAWKTRVIYYLKELYGNTSFLQQVMHFSLKCTFLLF